jgi:hypothetical protein
MSYTLYISGGYIWVKQNDPHNTCYLPFSDTLTNIKVWVSENCHLYWMVFIKFTISTHQVQRLWCYKWKNPTVGTSLYKLKLDFRCTRQFVPGNQEGHQNPTQFYHVVWIIFTRLHRLYNLQAAKKWAQTEG